MKERVCKCEHPDLPHYWGKVSEHPLAGVHSSMLTRCRNSKSKSFQWYGARGISVCAEWHCSRVFLAWAETRFEPGLQLDRKDNDGDYTPANCEFVPIALQARNKRSNRRLADGTLLRDAAEAAGLTFAIVRGRLDFSGWSLERALSEPVAVGDVAEKARAAGLSPFTVYGRLKRGLSLEQSLCETLVDQRRVARSKPESFAGICRAAGLLPSTVRARLVRGLSLDAALSVDAPDRRGKPRPDSVAGRARAAGVSYAAVQMRLRRGLSLEAALSPEVSEAARKFMVRPDSVAAMSRAAGLSVNTVKARLKAGWALERALAVGPLRRGRNLT